MPGIRSAAAHAKGIGAWGSSLIQSVQSGTIAMSSVQTTNTVTINAVAVDCTIVFTGSQNSNSGGSGSQETECYLTLTNATTLTVTRGATAAATLTCAYTVVEFKPGVLKSLQRGVILVTGAATNTAAINAVDLAKAFVNVTGLSVASDTDTERCTRIVLTDAVTLTATRSSATSSATIAYEVVEWW